MLVTIVPCLDDNYSYLIVDEKSQQCAIVDGVEPGKCMDAKGSASVSMILTTHSHWDHAGGNLELKSLIDAQTLGDIEVYGGKNDKAQAVTKELDDKDEIILGDIVITTLYTPCHTPGHVCYYAVDRSKPDEPGAVFTGDTLFVGGCGNFNSGTPEQMYEALITKLSALPENTLVCVGHEYTEKNLRYALTADKNNVELQKKYDEVVAMRKEGKFTVPSTILSEKQTNPFMRVHEKSLQEYTGLEDPIEVLAEIRKRKSAWRG